MSIVQIFKLFSVHFSDSCLYLYYYNLPGDPLIHHVLLHSPLNVMYLLRALTCLFWIFSPIVDCSCILRHVLLIIYQIFVLLALYLLVYVLRAMKKVLDVLIALRIVPLVSNSELCHHQKRLQIWTLILSTAQTFSIKSQCSYAEITSIRLQLVQQSTLEAETGDTVEDSIQFYQREATDFIPKEDKMLIRMGTNWLNSSPSLQYV